MRWKHLLHSYMHFTAGLLQLLYFSLALLSKKAKSLPHFWTLALAGDHTTNLRPATGPAANSPHKYEQQTCPRGKLDQREPGCIPATGVQQADVSYFTITKLVRVILFQQQTVTLHYIAHAQKFEPSGIIYFFSFSGTFRSWTSCLLVVQISGKTTISRKERRSEKPSHASDLYVELVSQSLTSHTFQSLYRVMSPSKDTVY